MERPSKIDSRHPGSPVGSALHPSDGLCTLEQAVRLDCLQLAAQLDRDGDDTGATIDRARAFADFVLKGSTSPTQPITAGLDVQAGGVMGFVQMPDGSSVPIYEGAEASAFELVKRDMAKAGAILSSEPRRTETFPASREPTEQGVAPCSEGSAAAPG